MARISWGTAARGGKVFPLLLIHGLPYVLTIPFGNDYLPNGVSLAGLPDLWWPGTDGPTIAGYARGWLVLGEGIEGFSWSEQSRPTEATQVEVSGLTVQLSDPGNAATAVFASADLAVGSYLTQTAEPADTTIHVVSTAAFAASGVIYLNREAIEYTGTTPTTFTGCTRARYGSEAQRHLYDAAAGSGLGNPEVTDRPTEMVGRLATLWLGHVEGGVLTKLSLEYVGHIGVGPQLPEDGSDGWMLSIVHASTRLGQSPRTPTVTLGGYAHPGNLGARAGYVVDGVTVYGANADRYPLVAPNVDRFSGSSTRDTRYVVTLTGDAADPDNGGWHPSREAYVDALNGAVQTLGLAATDSISYQIQPDGRLRCAWVFVAARYVQLNWDFDPSFRIVDPAVQTGAWVSTHPLPEAWVPIRAQSRLYLGAADYAAIPPVISLSTTADNTVAYWCLVWDEEASAGGATTRRAVRLTGNSSSGGLNYVIGTPILGMSDHRVQGAGRGTVRTVNGIFLTQPTTARVVLYVASDSWVSALQYAVTAVSADLGDSATQSIDWDRIRAIAAQYQSPTGARREYLVDVDTSLLSLLANECAVQGFCLTLYQGRLAITRIAEFATTETRVGAITTASLDAESPVPGYSRGEDGIVNTLVVKMPGANTTFNYVDQTSRARYGPSRAAITATIPEGLFERTIDGTQFTSTLAAMAVSVLGPLRYPYERVTIAATLLHYDLQVGNLVSVELWRIPNGSGTRGLPGPGASVRVAQVVSRAPVLFREGSEGLIHFTLRLNPTNLQGWAPGALVASIGGVPWVVTLDTTTFGANGCAQGGTDGGAVTFAVSDKVRLVEIDNTSPLAATQHTVTAVSGATLTLSPNPSGAFAAVAASGPARVLVMYDDADQVVAAQYPWAYLGDSTHTLHFSSGARRARVYAA